MGEVKRIPHNKKFYSPEERRSGHLMNTYGITLEDFDRMLDDQGGGCAICGGPPKRARLGVDHNHITGEVRGLLCELCNMGLGHFKTDEEGARLLKLAIKYMEKT